MLFTLRPDVLRENCPEAYAGMTELLESLGYAPETPG